MNATCRIRRAARLLVIDQHERVLLFRFAFAGRPVSPLPPVPTKVSYP